VIANDGEGNAGIESQIVQFMPFSGAVEVDAARTVKHIIDRNAIGVDRPHPRWRVHHILHAPKAQ